MARLSATDESTASLIVKKAFHANKNPKHQLIKYRLAFTTLNVCMKRQLMEIFITYQNDYIKN